MQIEKRLVFNAIALVVPLAVIVSIGTVWQGSLHGEMSEAPNDVDPVEEEQRFLSPDDELLQYAFTRELGFPVLAEPIESLEDILSFNRGIHTPVALFWEAERYIEILHGEYLSLESDQDVLVVDFLFDGRPRQAYAYADAGPSPNSPAVIITPGSGENQARKIVTGDPENYHCCLWSALESNHRYVLIKPNHGLRSQHDGAGRLSPEFIVNWHINTGSSYSAAYAVELIALKLYLSGVHTGPITLVGLSQGAKASLVASLVSPPDALVVSAGYSAIRHELALWSGHTSFMIPGMYEHTSAGRVSSAVDFPTLFTYGRQEYGIHKIEADTGVTCDLLESNRKILCEVHDVAHEFPEERIVEFLGSL